MNLWKLVTVALFFVLFSCGGDDSSSTDSSSPVLEQRTGQLVGIQVSGITYTTPTTNGQTSSFSEFEYLTGETIEFSVDAVSLGSVQASDIISPMDLASAGATALSDEVINRVRLLLTLDEDLQSDNGIQIPAGTSAVTSIDFQQSIYSFNHNSSVLAFIADITGERRALFSIESAVLYLTQLLNNSSYDGRPQIIPANTPVQATYSDNGYVLPFEVRNFDLENDGEVAVKINGIEANGFDIANKLVGLSVGKHEVTLTFLHHGKIGLGENYTAHLQVDVIEDVAPSIALVGYPPYKIGERFFLEAHGFLFTQDTYTADLSGVAVTLRRTDDNTLQFTVPDIGAGDHVLSFTVDGAPYSFNLTIESITLPADQVAYVDDVITALSQKFTTMLSTGDSLDSALLAEMENQLAAFRAEIANLSAVELEALVRELVANEDWRSDISPGTFLAGKSLINQMLLVAMDNIVVAGGGLFDVLIPSLQAAELDALGSAEACLSTLKNLRPKLNKAKMQIPSPYIEDPLTGDLVENDSLSARFDLILAKYAIEDFVQAFSASTVKSDCSVPLSLELLNNRFKVNVGGTVHFAPRIKLGTHPGLDSLLNDLESALYEVDDYVSNVRGTGTTGDSAIINQRIKSAKGEVWYQPISPEGLLNSRKSNDHVNVETLSPLKFKLDLEKSVKNNARFKQVGCIDFEFDITDPTRTYNAVGYKGNTTTADIELCADKPIAIPFGPIKVVNGGEFRGFLKGSGHEKFKVTVHPESGSIDYKGSTEPLGEFALRMVDVQDAIKGERNDSFSFVAVDKFDRKSGAVKVYIYVVPDDVPNVDVSTDGDAISINVTDDAGIKSIQAYINDEAVCALIEPDVGTVDFSYTCNIDPADYLPGEHQVRVTASDSSNTSIDWLGFIETERIVGTWAGTITNDTSNLPSTCTLLNDTFQFDIIHGTGGYRIELEEDILPHVPLSGKIISTWPTPKIRFQATRFHGVDFRGNEMFTDVIIEVYEDTGEALGRVIENNIFNADTYCVRSATLNGQKVSN